jgi:hypothetical protein
MDDTLLLGYVSSDDSSGLYTPTPASPGGYDTASSSGSTVGTGSPAFSLSGQSSSDDSAAVSSGMSTMGATETRNEYFLPGDAAAQRGWLPDNALIWEQVMVALQGGNIVRGSGERMRIPRRPQVLGHVVQHAVFLDAPKVKRRPAGSDVWACSGGVKGSTDFWFDSTGYGLRKRYGIIRRKTKADADEKWNLVATHKYNEYCVLTGGRENAVEDKRKSFFEVFSFDFCQNQRGYTVRRKELENGLKQEAAAPPRPPPPSPQASYVFERPTDQACRGALVDLRLWQGERDKASHGSANPKFISFSHKDAPSGSEIELGAIVRQGPGVTLTSGQGDFAEWHRRRAGEPPFEEGDVVGFDRNGSISRKTAGATMVGVISRKAVVEGSAPAAHERMEYDTVAYCGVVPVKVRRSKPSGGLAACECELYMQGPQVGNLLVPSGCNDGVAILGAASNTSSRVATVIENRSWFEGVGGVGSCEMLVPAMVTSPAESVRSGRYQFQRLFQRFGKPALVMLVLLVVALVVQGAGKAPPQVPVGIRSTLDASDSFPAAFAVSATTARRVKPASGSSSRSSRTIAANSRISDYFSGVYAKTALTCNGKPVYQMGRDNERGAVLVLVEGAPNWGSYVSELVWTLRFKLDGALPDDELQRCMGPWNNTFFLPQIPVHDGYDVGGWASGCKERPDGGNCVWHSSSRTNSIEVVPADPCTNRASCGHAAACFKVPAASQLSGTHCGSPMVLHDPGQSVPRRHDSGCVACSCRGLSRGVGASRVGAIGVYIGRQYCTNIFFINGTRNPRYTGLYKAVGDSFCNGKPVFQKITIADYRVVPLGPVLFQPTATSRWAIDDGWDQRAFSLAARLQNIDSHEDRCPLANASAMSGTGVNSCPESPDCTSAWVEKGLPNPSLHVSPQYMPRL